MPITQEQVEAGQAVYTRRTLALYDFFVLGISNRLIWRCPTSRILDLYHRHASDRHLDVGVGTGFFLDRCRFPGSHPAITLMDLNADALHHAARRISRYEPRQIKHSIFDSLADHQGTYDSVGLNYLLHCLPGTMSEKSIALDHVKEVMSDSAVCFGATLVQGGVNRGWAARRLMKIYNRKGIFSNEGDSVESLEAELEKRFRDVEIEIVGCAAIFRAWS